MQHISQELASQDANEAVAVDQDGGIQILARSIGEAFAGSFPDAEKSKGQLVGYITNNHIDVPLVDDRYRFQKDHIQALCFVWTREWTRREVDPRRGLLVGGPKAAGKTSFIEQFYGRLGVPVCVLTCDRKKPLTDYISKMVPDGEGGWMQIDGPLAIAMKQGYPVVLNEISVMDPEDLVAVHDVIDRGFIKLDNGEVIKAAQGFIIHATDNTMGYGDETGMYGGTGALNGATLRRFYKLHVDYPTADVELEILKAYYPDQVEASLEQYVKFAELIREPARRGAAVTMGTGELIEWVASTVYFAGMAAQGRSAAWYAFKLILGGIPAPEMEMAKKSFETAFNYDLSGE